MLPMRDKHPNEQLKIELLSQWKLEAESRNFHWEMLRKLNGLVPTYIGGPEKNLGTIPNVKFFMADPYFGVVFSTGLQKGAQNSTFLCFWTYRGGRVGTKKYGPQNIVGQG